MPHDRYYLNSPLLPKHSYSLEGNEWHHLQVTRSRPGKMIELVNGNGGLAEGRIETLEKRSITVVIEKVIHEKPPQKPFILCMGLMKKNLLDWVIEKGTELGASSFWLFPALRSDLSHLNDAMLKRLELLSIAAMKQSGRLFLPKIELLPPLFKWKKPKHTLLFGDLSPEAPYLFEINNLPLTPPLVLLTGPEKGLDPKEIAFLKGTLNAQGVKLHSNTLRAETAPIAGASLFQLIT